MIKRTNFCFSFGLIVFTLIIFYTGNVSEQITWGKQTLKRGKLWALLWNSLQYGDPVETSNSYDTLDYPG